MSKTFVNCNADLLYVRSVGCTLLALYPKSTSFCSSNPLITRRLDALHQYSLYNPVPSFAGRLVYFAGLPFNTLEWIPSSCSSSTRPLRKPMLTQDTWIDSAPLLLVKVPSASK